MENVTYEEAERRGLHEIDFSQGWSFPLPILDWNICNGYWNLEYFRRKGREVNLHWRRWWKEEGEVNDWKLVELVIYPPPFPPSPFPPSPFARYYPSGMCIWRCFFSFLSYIGTNLGWSLSVLSEAIGEKSYTNFNLHWENRRRPNPRWKRVA